MPRCKNDSLRSYKGTEPSPKGLGYCAHACEIGTVMKGNDGSDWKVVATHNNVKRWQKMIQSKDLAMPGEYGEFLKNIKTSTRSAEMIIYDWPSLSAKIKKQVSALIVSKNGKPCKPYSSESKCFIFSQMKDANDLMDKIDAAKLNVNADISYS